MTVGQLMANVSSYELSQWHAYYGIKEKENLKKQKQADAEQEARSRGTGDYSEEMFTVDDLPDEVRHLGE